jgi:hypothetical protein
MRQIDHSISHTGRSDEHSHTYPMNPAIKRWANLVCGCSMSIEEDVRTLADWARLMHVSTSTLRTSCYLAGTSPRASLLLARLLRAVVLAVTAGCVPSDLLDARDPRTLKKWLAKGGLSDLRDRDGCPDLVGFLEQQRIVTDPALVRAIIRSVNHLFVPGRS